MKSEIKPAVAVPVALAIIALIVFLFVRGSSSGEIPYQPKKSPNYIEGIPDYVKQGRAPNAQEQAAMSGAGGDKAPVGAGAPK